MCDRGGTFVALALFLMLFCDSTSSECTQLAPCVCGLPDGDYYDLTDLANKEILSYNDSNWRVSFHPCKDLQISFDLPNNTYNTCENGSKLSLCIFDTQKNKTLTLGTVQETQMKFLEGNNNFPVFQLQHNNTISVINIICVPDSKTHFIIDQINPDTNKYSFNLLSPHSCKKPYHGSLSTGSILVILLFTFGGIYFIGGAVALKTLRGATGWEMLPNHDFWYDLPSLVRDGIIFTFNCCRADSYERI